jgi:hypothetical protein
MRPVLSNQSIVTFVMCNVNNFYSVPLRCLVIGFVAPFYRLFRENSKYDSACERRHAQSPYSQMRGLPPVPHGNVDKPYVVPEHITQKCGFTSPCCAVSLEHKQQAASPRA